MGSSTSSHRCIEDFYEQIGKILKQLKNRDITIVMEDYNSKVRQGKEGECVGNCGLGQRNNKDRG